MQEGGRVMEGGGSETGMEEVKEGRKEEARQSGQRREDARQGRRRRRGSADRTKQKSRG